MYNTMLATLIWDKFTFVDKNNREMGKFYAAG